MAILTEIASLTLNAGENIGASCVFDTVNNNLYVACSTPAQCRLVKVNAGSLTRTGVISLLSPALSDCSVIDSTNGNAYVSTGVAPNATSIHRVTLSTFLENGAVSPTSAQNTLALDIDLSSSEIYLGSIDTNISPAEGHRLNGISTNTFTNNVTRENKATPKQQTQPKCLRGDYANGVFYLAQDEFLSPNFSIHVYKINAITLAVIGASISYSATGHAPNAMAIDLVNRMLYIGNGGAQSVTKINLDTARVVDTLSLLTGSDIARNSMIVDNCIGYLYVKSVGPAAISAINLSTFKVDQTLTLSSGGNSTLQGLAADLVGRFLYTSGSESPCKVLKMSLPVCPSTLVSTAGGGSAAIEGAAPASPRRKKLEQMPITRHKKGILWEY